MRVASIAILTWLLINVSHADTPKATCAAGEIAATRIHLSGLRSWPLYSNPFTGQLPNLGYIKETVFVAEQGYYKRIEDGTAFKVTEGAGKVFVGANRYISDVPSRVVTIETPTESLHYDELRPDKSGSRIARTSLSKEDQAAVVKFAEGTLTPLTDQTKVLGQAKYAGIDCTLRQFPIPDPNGRVCVGKVRGRNVVLLQDFKDPQTGKRQLMQAKEAEHGVCVSLSEFTPSTSVRFGNKLAAERPAKPVAADETPAREQRPAPVPAQAGGIATARTQARVIKVDAANFERVVLQSSLPVVVHFWAAWAGPARQMEPVVAQLALQYQGKIIVAVFDVDTDKTASAKYEVKMVPTLLLFKGGKVIDKLQGFRGEASVNAWFEKNFR